jgi:hypothetical protein
MNIFLKAFSLEQEPHIIVVTWFNPGGATYYNGNNKLISYEMSKLYEMGDAVAEASKDIHLN